MRVLDHAAAGGDRGRADDLKRGRAGVGDAVGEDEFDGLFDADPAAGDAAVLKR